MSDASEPKNGGGLGEQLGRAVDEGVRGTVRLTTGAVDVATLGVSRQARRWFRRRIRRPPGDRPGIELTDLTAAGDAGPPVGITVIDYGPDTYALHRVPSDGLPALLAAPPPGGARVRWVNVDGLENAAAVRAIAQRYGLHPLAIEDVLHVHQRPKVEPYGVGKDDGILFVVLRMLMLRDDRLHSEQVSIFLGRDAVITFQEAPGDVWEPVRQRLARDGTRLRQNEASFLLYALLDALVDHLFPLLERYAELLESIDEKVLDAKARDVLPKVHAIRHELMLLRREVSPTRDVLLELQADEGDHISDTTQLFFRDVLDHLAQALDMIDTYREFASSLAESHMSAVGRALNDVMKTLTMIATVFIPLTFIAGIYGMNFEHMPELDERWAYPAVWAVFISVGVGTAAWFRRKGWW